MEMTMVLARLKPHCIASFSLLHIARQRSDWRFGRDRMRQSVQMRPIRRGIYDTGAALHPRNLRAATLANTFEERYKEGGNGILDTPWLLLPLGPVAT
jgi:hypothetical protein